MNDAINSTCSHPINTNRVDIICLKALIIHVQQYYFEKNKTGEKTFNLEANELKMKKTFSMRIIVSQQAFNSDAIKRKSMRALALH